MMIEKLLEIHKQGEKMLNRPSQERMCFVSKWCIGVLVAVLIQYLYAYCLKKMGFEIGYGIGIMNMGVVGLAAFFLFDREMNSQPWSREQVLYYRQKCEMTIENLQKFNIDYKDVNKINLLIEEIQRYQKREEKRIEEIKKYFPVITGSIIFFIVETMVNKFVTLITVADIWTLGIMVIGIVIVMISINMMLRVTVVPIIKEGYGINTCEDLIGTLREIQLFT